MYPYEKLIAWRECHRLAVVIYEATSAFPKYELYGLTSQTRRAAVSAAANIVEGSAKRGIPEFRRYLDIALGSLAEVSYLLRLAGELGFLSQDQLRSLDDQSKRAGFLTPRLYNAIAKRK